MIYSASRRTDMVAFYPDVIVDRVRRSRKLDAIVFWTKNIQNLVDHRELRRAVETYPCIVNYTVTGLAATEWEPGVPSITRQLPALREFASIRPGRAVQWRFDPVIPEPDWHSRFIDIKNCFSEILGEVKTVTVSFPDPYRHAVKRTVRNGLSWPDIGSKAKRTTLARMVAAFGDLSSLPVRVCCEPEFLDIPGVGQAHCIDSLLFDSIYGTAFGNVGKDTGQRTACGCMKSTDIGSYAMSCGHRCRYCYANRDS